MEEMGLAALALTIEFGPYNDKVYFIIILSIQLN